MLRALQTEAETILASQNSTNTAVDTNATSRQLQNSPVYDRALQQLLSTDVEGCTKDLERALCHKAQGTDSYQRGAYSQAAVDYSDALTWLPAAAHAAEAARLHSNRALCLLKLAQRDLDTPPAAAAAAAAAAVAVPAAAVADPTAGCNTDGHSHAQQLAASAVDDCDAALDCCEQALRHKVLHRRAQACLLLQQHDQAAADCQAAIAAAQQSAAPGSAAAVRECQQLLASIQSKARSEAAVRGEVSATDSVQQLDRRLRESLHKVQAPQQPEQQTQQQQEQRQTQQQHRQQQQQQPPAGPSLEQFDMLLAYQQHQAWLLLPQRQQQQSSAAGAQDPLLQQLQALCLSSSRPPGVQQDRDLQQAAAPACAPTVRCCYSPTKGRFLVAATDIQPGSVVLAEWPLAAVAVKHKKAPSQGQQQQQQQQGWSGQMCCWCLRKLGLAVWPCEGCTLALYCTPACRQAASIGHTAAGPSTAAAAAAPAADVAGRQPAYACCAEHAPEGLECGRPWSRLLPEEAVLASRVLRARAAAAAAAAAAGALDSPHVADARRGQSQQQLPQQWQELCQQQQQPCMDVLRAMLSDTLTYHPTATSAPDSSSSSCHGGAISSGQFSTGPQQRQDVQQVVVASLVSSIHTHAAAAATASTPAGHCRSVQAAAQQAAAAPAAAAPSPADVAKCLQQLVANGIAIKPFLSSGPDDRCGLGLYPVTAAVVNHSCDPNCSIRFTGRQLLLVCHRGAAAGQELNISYGPQLGVQATQQRQALLQQQYGFTCTCSSCSDGLRKPHSRSTTTAAAAAGGCAAVAVGAAQASAALPVWQHEAAAKGLRCSCSTGNSHQDSGTGSSKGSKQTSCSGAVVLDFDLPAGLVSVDALVAGSSTGSSTGSSGSGSGSGGSGSRGLGGAEQATCTVCGWVMPAQLLQQKLLALQAAAADAEAACSIMAEVQQQQQQQQQQHQQLQQQASAGSQQQPGGSAGAVGAARACLRRVQQAVALLGRATAVRQQHLAAGNLLLGHSHHSVAAAAAEAAVLAAAMPQHSSSNNSSARCKAHTQLQQSLAVLQDSLRMQTEADVCRVLLRQQQLLVRLQASVPTCGCTGCCSSRSGAVSAGAVLLLPCKHAEEASARQQPQGVLQDSLSAAFRQFRSSAAVLAANHPADSLALAAERTVACAAGLAVVAAAAAAGGGCSCVSQAGTGNGPPLQALEQQQGQQQSGSCCRCGGVLQVVAGMLQEVLTVLAAHLGVLV